jgi:serine/threonine protein kinase
MSYVEYRWKVQVMNLVIIRQAKRMFSFCGGSAAVGCWQTYMLACTMSFFDFFLFPFNSVLNLLRRRFIDRLKTRARRIYPATSAQSVLQLTRWTILKMGVPATILNEAKAMQYISRYTSIPLPKVIDFWSDDERDIGYLVMEKMEGVPLKGNLTKLTEEQTRKVAAQLHAFLNQLRRLRPPQQLEGMICSVDGGVVRDDKLDEYGIDGVGPFTSVAAYHDWRFTSTKANAVSKVQATYDEVDVLRTILDDDYQVLFTHGDIYPGNILLKFSGDDVNISAILDWETAGWRPEYWEYVKMMYAMQGNNIWRDLVGIALDATYEKEKEIDDQCQQILGSAI